MFSTVHVNRIATGILVLGAVGITMVPSVASDTSLYEDKATAQRGPTPMTTEARPLGLTRGTGFDVAMFMVNFLGRGMKSVLPATGDARYIEV